MATSLLKSKANRVDAAAGLAKARLVLAVGSQSGREALLQNGYYMIGRHRECQIRPKSRSVSRRHCLLFRDETGLQVLDLGSSAGTRVNDRRLPEKTWTRLRQGDVLRCGKVLFRVDLGFCRSAEASSDSLSLAGRPAAGSVPVGEAWHDVDVAGFLEAQDDVDRAQRYEDIRSAHRQDSEFDDSDDFQSTTEIDIDLDLFEDAFQDADPQRPNHQKTGSRSAAASSQPLGEQGRATSISSTHGSTEAGSPGQRRRSSSQRSKADNPLRSATNKPVRKSSSRRLPRLSLNLAGNGDRLKVVGITLCLLVALGVLGASVYHFYSGPSVRVLKSID